MVTIFACPKPFTDPHISLIQRNAITSWTRLNPLPEIILFGDEKGTGEICRELKLCNVPQIARGNLGTPLLSDIFLQAEKMSKSEILVYINSDIILLDDFMPCVGQLERWRRRFLCLCTRTDIEMREALDFSDPNWRTIIKNKVPPNAKELDSPTDAFVFTKDVFGEIPPFYLGRFYWDNWLVWRARSKGFPVVNAGKRIWAIHQLHDRPFIEETSPHMFEIKANLEMAGALGQLAKPENANYEFGTRGITSRFFQAYYKTMADWCYHPKNYCIHFLIRIGIRKSRIKHFFRKMFFRHQAD